MAILQARVLLLPCLQVLTPLQIALICGAAYPLIPDATAIADVALELASVANSQK